MVWPFPAGVLVLNTPNSCGGQSGAGPGGVWTEDARQRAPGSISHGCIQPTRGPLPPAAPVLPKFPFPLPPHHPCPAFSLRSHRKLTNPNKGRRAPTNSSKGQDWASPNPRKGQVEEPPIRTKDRLFSLSLLGRELGVQCRAGARWGLEIQRPGFWTWLHPDWLADHRGGVASFGASVSSSVKWGDFVVLSLWL